jgi:hypothetical protein
MSYAIMRVQKARTSTDVTGLQIHNRRERPSRSNPDIDPRRREQNYNLLDTEKKTYNDLIDERIKEGYTLNKTLRKDAVRLCELLFTSDDEFFNKLSQERQCEYFTDCLKWVQVTFGSDNIIYATCHGDEAGAPHLHVGLVPITSEGGLSANTIFNGRKAMQDYQNRFHKAVCEKWGLERGTIADLDNPEAGRPRKHERHQDFKRRTRAEIIKETELEANKIKAEAEREAEQLKTAAREAARQSEKARIAAEKALDDALCRADELYQERNEIEEARAETAYADKIAEIEARIDFMKQDGLKIEQEINTKIKQANDDIAKLAKGRKAVEEFIKTLDLPKERDPEADFNTNIPRR